MKRVEETAYREGFRRPRMPDFEPATSRKANRAMLHNQSSIRRLCVPIRQGCSPQQSSRNVFRVERDFRIGEVNGACNKS
jgi:hypothetical protein